MYTNKAFKKYIATHSVPKLQLGAGTNELTGWFNTDYFARPAILFLDVTKPFLFPDNCFTAIFSEHHIEHITYQNAQLMLSEIYRVLKPEGRVKITTPDLRKYIHGYADGTLGSTLIKQHVQDWIYSGFDKAATYKPVNEYYDAHFINDIFLNYEHRFIYDEQALKTLLEQAGFNNITAIGNDRSSNAVFHQIASHDTHFDQMFTLCMEAQKL